MMALVTVLPLLLVSGSAQAQVDGVNCDADPEVAVVFEDVAADSVFCVEIGEFAALGLTRGRADGTFGPGEPVTRGAMAAFLYRLARSPDGPFDDPGFVDVDATSTFATEIAWLATTGVTVGRDDDTFEPGEPVTRGAMAAFLYRLAGSPDGPFDDPGFVDVDATSTFATEIAWLATTGVTVGRDDGTFGPGEPVIRGAMAAFLTRHLTADLPILPPPSEPARGPTVPTPGPTVPAPDPTVPAAPTALEITPGDQQLVIVWQPTADDGGAPVQGYTVTLDPPDQGPYTVAADAALLVSAEDLTNGTTYTVTVVADNAVGSSAAATGTGTPRTVPDAPRALTITPGDTRLDVAWQAPASDGGSTITGYTVSVSPGRNGYPKTVTGLTDTITGLTDGTEYTVSVVADNAAGSSAAATGTGTPQLVFTAVSAGSRHTCGIADGKAYCWGAGSDGQLGSGDRVAQSAPVAVATGRDSALPPEASVTAIAAGELHTCAIADGNAYCWGDGGAGKLGNGATADHVMPVAVATTDGGDALPAGATVTAISSGRWHTCAVADGDAYCWGYGRYGQLGNGGTTDQSTPAGVATTDGGSALPAAASVTAISGGRWHTCAVAGGDAYCWGDGRRGKLGNDGAAVDQTTPIAVTTTDGGSALPAAASVTSISGGHQHTCAVADGTAYCWGYGELGQLGNGGTATEAAQTTPVAVTTTEGGSALPAGASVTAISTGSSHTCAVADGHAYCWGFGTSGQLGNGGTIDRRTPVAVTTTDGGSALPAGASVTAISGGLWHTCAVADGDAYCWGYGGPLGSGETTSHPTPVAVLAPTHLVFTAVSAGSRHTCGIKIADGDAYCWGYSLNGQLGNGGTASRSLPVPVATGGGSALPARVRVTAISAGDSHTCAIAGGSAYCWGGGLRGQLGDGGTADQSLPVAVATGSGSALPAGATVTAISAGFGHTCAIADGNAYCWGDGTDGQLGNGGTTTQSTPVAVTTRTGGSALPADRVTAVSAGWGHTCAIAVGVAYCWGDGSDGQLGNGDTADQSTPVAVTTTDGDGVLPVGSTVSAISAGDRHTCAVALGDAYCWGDGGSGQLGNGETASRSTPVAVTTDGGSALPTGATVTAISAGVGHTCAIALWDAYCWGAGEGGRLGDGGTPATQSTPVAVATGGGSALEAGASVTAISASLHTCAVADGNAYCWGYGTGGQLGTGDPADQSTPVAVTTDVGDGALPVGASATAMSAGDRHTCGIADSTAYCWGQGSSGQLGNGDTTSQLTPVAVTTTDGGGALPAEGTVTAISAGARHTCAVADGDAYCWGDGGSGQLGNGDPTTQSTPVAVATGVGSALPTGASVTAISAGGDHTCAIADGDAYCWGRGWSGQLGDGGTATRPTPVAVTTDGGSALPTGATVTAISAGETHTCAVADGDAYCWGNGGDGRLGDGGTVQQVMPVAVATDGGSALPAGANVTAISAGTWHTCAVADGNASCWGFGEFGQLGNGGTPTTQSTPVAVTTGGASALAADATVTAISAGGDHTCAVADGDAYCWGTGGDGRLGDGGTVQQVIPVAVATAGGSALPAGANVTAISAGGSHACAVADANASCWGDGWYGQLGNGDTVTQVTPVAVTTTDGGSA